MQEREDIIDEDLYILRDSKKEKEFGFNMGVSLARARQNPLLKVSHNLLVSVSFLFSSLVLHYTSGKKGLYNPKYKAWFEHNHNFG